VTLFFRDFESLGQYHDHWSVVVLLAPDEFHDFDGNIVDQRRALEEAFDVLRSGFIFVERKIKDQRQLGILRELIEMSHEAYIAGDNKAGAHTLQECEGLIWPSRLARLKYVVEAERRAHGQVILYAHVKVSPYPYEGSAKDLTSEETTLWAEAKRQCHEFFAKQEDFKPFVLVRSPSGGFRQLKQQSWKKSKEEILSQVAQGACMGFVKSEVVVSGMSGVLIHTIESKDRPQISVRSLVRNYVCESPLFHLDEPNVLDTKA
jgi:hypothetical protein